jgi:hypothetical protein
MELSQEEFWKRIQAVKEHLYSPSEPKESRNQPMEIRWMLACAAIGEKHSEVIKYGKGII